MTKLSVSGVRENRARRSGGATQLVAGLMLVASLLAATNAAAETFVLVYSEGSVVVLPGGARIEKGQKIDGEKIVQLGPADKAVFIAQSGNVVCHNGPFSGAVADSEMLRDRGGLLDSVLALFGAAPTAPASESCLK